MNSRQELLLVFHAFGNCLGTRARRLFFSFHDACYSLLPEHDIITTEYHPAVHNGLQWYGGGLAEPSWWYYFPVVLWCYKGAGGSRPTSRHNSISQTYTAPPRYLLNLVISSAVYKRYTHTASNTQRCRDPFCQYDVTLLERKSWKIRCGRVQSGLQIFFSSFFTDAKILIMVMIFLFLRQKTEKIGFMSLSTRATSSLLKRGVCIMVTKGWETGFDRSVDDIKGTVSRYVLSSFSLDLSPQASVLSILSSNSPTCRILTFVVCC